MDRLLGGTGYAMPFEAIGFLDEGRSLIRSFDNVPAMPASHQNANRGLAYDFVRVLVGPKDSYAVRPGTAETKDPAALRQGL